MLHIGPTFIPVLAISFSGLFKPIGSVFKGISSQKFSSILSNVVLPLAAVGIGIKNAATPQQLPSNVPPVQPSQVAPDTAAAAGAAGQGNKRGAANSQKGAPWYTNPVVYVGGAVVLLLGAIILGRKGGR